MRFKILAVVIAIFLTVSCFRSQRYGLPEDKLSRLKSLNEIVNLPDVFAEKKWDYICRSVEYSKPSYNMSVVLDLETKQYSFYGPKGTGAHQHAVSLIHEKNKLFTHTSSRGQKSSISTASPV